MGFHVSLEEGKSKSVEFRLGASEFLQSGGLGLQVQGVGCRVCCLGFEPFEVFRGYCSWFGFRVWRLGFRV